MARTERHDPGCGASRRAKEILLAIPEDVLTRLIDPTEISGCADDEHDLDAALAYRIALASAEIAQSLVETGRSLSYIHVLREAVEIAAAHRGYREGALAAGQICHALARETAARK